MLLRYLSHALKSGGLLLAHELVLCDHLASLGRNRLVFIKVDHMRRLVDLKSVAILLNQLDKGVVNGARDFFLETIKSNKVLD